MSPNTLRAMQSAITASPLSVLAVPDLVRIGGLSLRQARKILKACAGPGAETASRQSVLAWIGNALKSDYYGPL